MEFELPPPKLVLFVELYIFTVYDRIFGDFPVKNAANTPYIYFWPTLIVCPHVAMQVCVCVSMLVPAECGWLF
jgi:hypothetical protein